MLAADLLFNFLLLFMPEALTLLSFDSGVQLAPTATTPCPDVDASRAAAAAAAAAANAKQLKGQQQQGRKL